MNKIDITYEVRDLRQTNGKTYHVSFNRGNSDAKCSNSRDSVIKMAETVLLPLAIIDEEAAAEALKIIAERRLNYGNNP